MTREATVLFVADAEEVADRLAGIADELGDLAYDKLHQASALLSRGEEPDPELLAVEKKITRARRAVEKAVHLLRSG